MKQGIHPDYKEATVTAGLWALPLFVYERKSVGKRTY